MAFSGKLKTIVTGCDNGTLALTRVIDEDKLKYHEYFVGKVHSKRIMSVFIDEKTCRVYSISEDKYLKVFDIESKQVIYELFVSSKKLTAMLVDSEHGVAYIGDRKGSVAVVSLSSNPPMLK